MKIRKTNKSWVPVTIQIDVETEADALAIFNLYNSEHPIMKIMSDDLEYLDFKESKDIECNVKKSISKLLGGMYGEITNI